MSIRENLRWTKIQHMAATKIQRKYRRYVERKDFGPNMQLSLYEIKKMLDKVRVIQNWWRNHLKTQSCKGSYLNLKANIGLIQKFVKKKLVNIRKT